MSVHKREKNVFEIDIYLGRDPITGKRLRDIQRFHGTFTGAKAEERRLLRERDLGTYVSPSTITVAEYLEQWLRDSAKPTVAATTYEGYCRCIHKYIVPHIGHVGLCKLRPLHVQSMYAALQETPKDKKRGPGNLSGHTVLHAHRVLRQALKQAVRWQLVAVNVCDAVEPPRRERKEMKAITESETAKLLRGLAGTRYHAPVLIAVSCGLRRGELLGLRWQDIDLEQATLSVRQALEQTKAGGIRMKEPKTPKSKRQIVIPSLALAALETHQEEQEARRKEQGNTWKDNNLVFPGPDGSPWSPSLFSRMFTFHARQLGIGCRLHDLRHSHATQLLSAGVHPKIVSERLGHSTVAFTLDTYTHAVQGMDRDAASRIGDNLQAALLEVEKASKEKLKRHLSVVS